MVTANPNQLSLLAYTREDAPMWARLAVTTDEVSTWMMDASSTGRRWRWWKAGVRWRN